MTCRVIESGWVEPIRVFRAADGAPGRVFLDSGGPISRQSRWSVLTVRPLETIDLRVGEGLHCGVPATDPFSHLASFHREWAGRASAEALRIDHSTLAGTIRSQRTLGGPRLTSAGSAEASTWADMLARSPDTSTWADTLARSPDSPPFTGGVIVLVGYDAGRTLERLPAIAKDDTTLPDLWAAVYDGAVVFDRQERRVLVTRWGLDGPGRAQELLGLLDAARGSAGDLPGRACGGAADTAQPGASDWCAADALVRSENAACESTPERERFLAGVSRIREEIARGEIYQANLTRRVVARAHAERAPSIYERLRSLTPTPFGAFVDAGSFQLLSASPERFLTIQDGTVETRPIKGTRRRGKDETEDAALQAELLSSAKDAAELLMIVDLERNDLGRVSRAGTVSVEPFPQLEQYSSVSHLVATVRGRLRQGAGVEAVLRAAFPGGSITGAPKIRAMEILEQLEPHRRKFAMGSLLAWDFGGDLDSSILIRTIVLRAGEAVFNVGAGIVADSNPNDEYRETVAKAAPLTAALEGA